ncbi:MAG: betaine-aldehyde dehydrogenase [Solirubrobacterales bacterium 70-9]|nr:MAG: betaine-aldehyde dehydrogenase [Solirubrobacterales bacterium 70-9]
MTESTALLDLEASDLRLLIGGERVDASSGERFDVLNPATGETIATVPAGTSDDVDAAVAAARAALPGWIAMAPAARAELLWNLGTRIAELSEELATLEAMDNGKTRGDALMVDIPLASEIFRYYAGWATKIEGSAIPTAGGLAQHVYTIREPVGVVAAIVPWNFPLLMCAYKAGPSLAAGNTLVIKPAEQTPLAALRLADLVAEVGFPPGVVNVVTGDGPNAGAPLAAHPGVDKVTFTGETTTGQKILDASKGNLKRVSLELGGKSPSVVFADADIDAAVEGTYGAVYFNQGQCCIAGARVFVHEDVHDAFVEKLLAKLQSVKLGSGLDADTDMGPLVSAEQAERVAGYIAAGREEGAHELAGGGPAELGGEHANGYFVKPALFTDVNPEMRVMREEIFGPVGMVSRFSEEDEAIAGANDTVFGLASGIWTRDVKRAHRVASQIHAGTVWINTYGFFDVAVPYGGFRMSGYGKELGKEALDPYLQTKSVWTDLS